MVDNNANLTSIIIALLGLATLLITLLGGSVVWTVRWFARHYGSDLKAHTTAANSQAKANNKLALAVDRNTQSNAEVLTFMKNLNGKLAKATIQTVKEQQVEHQTIKSQDIE